MRGAILTELFCSDIELCGKSYNKNIDLLFDVMWSRGCCVFSFAVVISFAFGYHFCGCILHLPATVPATVVHWQAEGREGERESAAMYNVST